jgi:hypothetical protein
MMILLILTVLITIDYVCTYIGVHFGYVVEGNPLVAPFFNDLITPWFLLIFIIGVLYFIYKYIDKFKWVKYALVFCIIARIPAIVLHFIWIRGVIYGK